MVSNMQMNVTKRNGSKELFQVEKIRQCIEFACEGLDAEPLALESLFNETLFDGITTSAIQENLIQHAKTLCSTTSPDWTFVAGRLETMQLWANTRAYEQDFIDFFKEQRELGLWAHESFGLYSDEEIEIIGDMIDKERDLNHSYASVLTAKEKYLLPGECIQHIFIGNAMIIEGHIKDKAARLKRVKRTYDRFSNREISQATPWLGNLRSGGNISSCFIMDIPDDIEGIYAGLTNAARISKSGGGLGIHMGRVRARGSWLMGYFGRSGGIMPWIRLQNDTAVAVNQAGKRAGAFTVAVPAWHADVEEFFGCQREEGDLRMKAFDIQPQLVAPDLFMELTNEKGTEDNWHTFCPYEVKRELGIEIVGTYGEEFRRVYDICVEAKKQGVLKVGKAYNAKALLKLGMKTMFETGMPYISFIDRINEVNPNKHEGFIPCVNLCVAPETQILTDAGHITIGDHEGEKVNVWNGQEFSEVEIVKTGTNQELLKVYFDNERVLECTHYHKFYVYGVNKEIVEKRANQLKIGDQIIDFSLPGMDEILTIKIESVEYTGRISDTYCFTEPKRHMGVFNGILTGQCTESFSNVVAGVLDHTCNLLSIVVGRVGIQGLEEAAYDATYILDAGIDLTNPPTKNSKDHNQRYRTIGIGIQGLHDIIALEGSHYFDERFITEVAERIQFGAVRASIELAKANGPYPAFKGSEWDNGNMIRRFREHSVVYGDRWNELQEEIDKYGIRNSQLTSPAPNTTTSIFMDAAAGVMPVWGAFFYEDNKNGLMPVVAMHLKGNPLSYSRDVTRFNPWDLTKPVSWIQRFTDTGVSAEYLMDKNREDFNAKFLWDTIQNAWRNGTKAVYYIRNLKKGERLVKGDDLCAGCAG